MKILALFFLLILQSCFADDLLKINQIINNLEDQIHNKSYDYRVFIQTSSKVYYFSPILKKCIVDANNEIEILSKEIESINKILNLESVFTEKQVESILANQNEYKIRLSLLRHNQYKKSFCELMVSKLNRLKKQLSTSSQKLYENHLFHKQEDIFNAFYQYDEPIIKKSPNYYGIRQYIQQANVEINVKLIVILIFMLIFLKFLNFKKLINNTALTKNSISKYSNAILIFLVVSPLQYIFLKIIYSHHNEFLLYIFHQPILVLITVSNYIYICLFYKSFSFKKDFLLILVHFFLMILLTAVCLELNYLLINNFSNQEILIKKYLILIFLQPILYSVIYWLFWKILEFNFHFKFMKELFFVFTNFILILGLIGYVNLAVNLDFIIIINSICIALLFMINFLKNSLFLILDKQQSFTQKILYSFFQNNSKLVILNIKITSYILYICTIFFLISFIIVYLGFWFIPSDFYQNLYAFIYAKKNIGLFSFTIPRIIESIFLFNMLNLVNYAASQYLATKLVQDKVSRKKTNSLFNWLGYMLSIIIVLTFIGFNLNDFIIIFGGLSLGIGLGLKNLLSSLISSIILFINPSFKKGDFIEIGQTKGYVKNISLLETTIETSDNNIMILPNQYVASSVIQNFTYEDKSFQTVHLYYTINNFNIDEEENIKSKILEELSKNPYFIASTHQEVNLFFSLLDQTQDIYRLEIVFSLSETIHIKEEMSKINRKIYEKMKRMHLDLHYENMQHPYM